MSTYARTRTIPPSPFESDSAWQDATPSADGARSARADRDSLGASGAADDGRGDNPQGDSHAGDAVTPIQVPTVAVLVAGSPLHDSASAPTLFTTPRTGAGTASGGGGGGGGDAMDMSGLGSMVTSPRDDEELLRLRERARMLEAQLAHVLEVGPISLLIVVFLFLPFQT
jgi:hypothetical protein